MASSSHALNFGHRDPQNPYNETTQRHSEALWSEATHPNILGQLDPHPKRTLLKAEKVPNLVEHGRLVYDAKNEPIRDFTFLPRYLSSNLEPFRYEAYFRMDPRLTHRDLWARMPSTTPDFEPEKVRALGMRITRKVRDRNNARCWKVMGKKPPRRNVELVESLTQEQIELNTTWTVTSDGVRQPNQPLSSTPLPRNHFLAPREITHTLSLPLQKAREELGRLQNIAERKGRNGWKEVPEDHLYEWTMRRRKSTRAKETAEATEAAHARSTHEAALTMLELASGRRENSVYAKSRNDNAENTIQALGIDMARSVQAVEADIDDDSIEDQPMSDEADLEDVGTDDQPMFDDTDDIQDGNTPSDEDELRWVVRAVRCADGTFSKSCARPVGRSATN
jgi:hypothetical protein